MKGAVVLRYSTFQFGHIFVNGVPQEIPQTPAIPGTIPRYVERSDFLIKIGELPQKEGITWVKPNGMNLLVADRALLVAVSWETLALNGFTTGVNVVYGGQRFLCRLLQVGEDEGMPNEWDEVLNATGNGNKLWHWSKVSFWGLDKAFGFYAAVRGNFSSRFWAASGTKTIDTQIGFRPVLIPLGAKKLVPNCKLDGEDFCLSKIPDAKGFCPILQPILKDTFANIPNGEQLRMYTITENGRPVCMNKPVKDIANLELTDHYFGDRYLVSWTVSNGIAVASQALQQKI